MDWLKLLRSGDWLVLFLSLAVCFISFPLSWHGGVAEKAVIRRGGEILGEFDLSRNRRIDVSGPLGITRIAIDRNRVRVISDPGLHQYCVRQGWLQHAGEIAICAPNQVSVQVVGTKEAYDSLSY